MKSFTYHSHVYFDELDALGVLHHTRYLLHLERAQQKFFEHLLGVDDFNAERDEDIYVVVHSLTAKYKQALRNPGAITVHYQISKVRAGGVTMQWQVASPDAKTTFATGERTVCKLSGKTHQPTTWTEPFRKVMEAYVG